MSVYDVDIDTLDGESGGLSRYKGKALLVVNVASQCGLTPQYAGLQRLYDTYRERGLEVLGFPCNQFGAQEPGTPDEIKTFCETSYGVTFPMFEKIEVNGPGRHALYEQLTAFADSDGAAGDIQWNFEKFLLSPEGEVVGRFRPLTDPEAPELVEAVKAQLPG